MAAPRFKAPTNDFFSELKNRINAHFEQKGITPSGNHKLFTKAIILVLSLIGFYVHLVFFTPPNWLALLECILMGGVAASIGFKEGARKAKPVLLEPIMRVEVTTPEDFMGDVMGDLNARRGRIEGMEPRGTAQVVRALVPLGTMFGYATDLRSATQGRAVYSMHFDHYAEVPSSIAAELVEAQV